jgi:hypothetical protein
MLIAGADLSALANRVSVEASRKISGPRSHSTDMRKQF